LPTLSSHSGHHHGQQQQQQQIAHHNQQQPQMTTHLYQVPPNVQGQPIIHQYQTAGAGHPQQTTSILIIVFVVINIIYLNELIEF